MKVFFENLGNPKLQSRLIILVVVITFALMFMMNIFYPLVNDDWIYSCIFGEKIRLASISDIFESQYIHYFIWGGRSVVHFIAQLLLFFPPIVHNFLNAAALVLYVFILYRIAIFGRSNYVAIFIIITLLIWFAQPASHAVLFWITGSANYLWGMLIVILFLYSYYLYYRRGYSDKGSAIQMIGMFLLGVLAGWTNENLPFAMGTFIICFYILLKNEKRSIPNWAIAGLVGMIIGAVLMIKAPGNYVRLNLITKDEGITFDYLIGNISPMLGMFRKRILLPLVVPYLVVFYFLYRQRESVENYRRVISSSLIFLLAGEVAFAAMIGAVSIPLRALFGILSFHIVAIAILMANLSIKKLPIKTALLSLVSLGVVVFFVDFYSKSKTYRHINAVYKEREQVVIEGKKKGQTEFVFYNKLSGISPKVFEGDVGETEDPEFFSNVHFSMYHNIDSVKVYSADAKKLVEEQEEVVK